MLSRVSPPYFPLLLDRLFLSPLLLLPFFFDPLSFFLLFCHPHPLPILRLGSSKRTILFSPYIACFFDRKSFGFKPIEEWTSTGEDSSLKGRDDGRWGGDGGWGPGEGVEESEFG